MSLVVEFCPYCMVRALVYDNDATLLDRHIKTVHKA